MSHTKFSNEKNYYTISTNDSCFITYLYLANSILKKGDPVNKGQYMGNTSFVDDNTKILHLIIRDKKKLFTQKEYLEKFKACLQ